MVKLNRAVIGTSAFGLAVAIGALHAQVGRGGSEWLTARGDAQRTSWIRTDARISVDSMSRPGFELQWSTKLDNRTRGVNGLTYGVTANGVTLFVPMSVVGGSSNNIYALDNDTGYVVWQRHFDAPLPAETGQCPGGMTTGATRIVPLEPPAITLPNTGGGRGAQAYRSVIGQPGEGAPVEVRGGGAGRGAPPATPPARGTQGAAQGAVPQRANNPAPPLASIPGATAEQLGGGRGGLGRASGVVYAVSSDGILHVLGLPSGKDMQKPAEFIPANARWTDTIAVGTTLYATTSGGCGGAPNAVWAIDLDKEGRPVVSWKSGGPLVGPIAFTNEGTVIAATGRGLSASGDKPTSVVALDGTTLQLKDWYNGSSSDAEFATGPSVFREGNREIVAAATRDGRLVLLDAAALGGANHATPLASASLGSAGRLTAASLATWQEMTITAPPAPSAQAAAVPGPPPAPVQPTITLGTRWILAPVEDGVVAFKVVDRDGAISLEQGWRAQGLSTPETPIVVNGVVFALATGRPSSASGAAGTPAVLHAYEGDTGKELWTSGKTMAAFASPGSYWSAMGQVYVGTNDGTLYAFGFADERR